MANLKDCPKWKVMNEYYTHEYAWKNIEHIIPKDKVIWEACMLNSHKSKSPEYLEPFILILNSLNIYSNYMRDILKDNMKHLQFIIPKGKIHFDKLLENGDLSHVKNTSFYCIYLCYKMNISNEDLWLK